jgi:two-component system, CitB family, sensor histidine kinase MalK
MKKGKWSLQTTITIFVCAVVALSLLITDLLISQTVAETIEDSQAEKAGNAARMMARSPLVIQALSGKGDERDIQSFANEIQSVTDVQFVVVMDMKGIRKSHPDPNKVGKRFVGGDEEAVLKGKEHVSISEGTLGHSLRSFTPVFDANGKQVGAVAVGISLDKVNKAVGRSRGDIYVGTILGIVTGIVGAVILARYIKKILFGLEPFAIAKLLEERSAMLQSVREGIIAVDQDSRITLVNKAALGLLQKAGLDENPVGKKIDAYMVTSKLSRVLQTGQAQQDEELNLNGVALMANRVPVFVDNKIVGAVATFRDKTEISQLAEQLTGVRLYAEALRAQSHEFMNKLHVILGMVHMRYYDQLASYISEIAGNNKNEIGFIARKIKDPVLAGFLIGKLSYARESGAELVLSSEFQVPEPEDTSITHELITIIGNLIDNALEATEKSQTKQIEVEFDFGDEILTVEVKDTGIGIDEEIQNHILQKGFSTKGDDRGFGLYLVNESLQKLGGELDISSKKDQGTTIVVYIPYKSKGDTK